MNVRELIAILQKEDPERIVICSCDAEGNGYSPLASASRAAYLAENTWSGEIGLEELTAEDRAAGYSEEDVCKKGVPALILQPVN